MKKVAIQSSSPYQWPKVETFHLGSACLNRDLRISATNLTGGDAAGKRLFVYLLDPSFNFSAAVATATFLGNFARLAGGHWPELVIAGVGYDTDDPREVMARRALDLTPTPKGVPAGVQLPPLSFGGAEAFLTALREEVVPMIEGHFGAAASSRLLAGHSFGGLFGLYTLFHRPQDFDGYVLLSPSIWWDDRIVFRYERASRETGASLASRVFLAVGDKEQSPGAGWRNEGFPDEAVEKLRQVDNCRELAALLETRRRDGLRTQSAVIADEYHLTVFPAAFARGLRWMIDELSGDS